jgi:hypothetical protein
MFAHSHHVEHDLAILTATTNAAAVAARFNTVPNMIVTSR